VGALRQWLESEDVIDLRPKLTLHMVETLVPLGVSVAGRRGRMRGAGEMGYDDGNGSRRAAARRRRWKRVIGAGGSEFGDGNGRLATVLGRLRRFRVVSLCIPL